MLIDRPICHRYFKDCKFFFDGNCASQEKYDKCELQYMEKIIRCKDCVFRYFNEKRDGFYCGRFGTRYYQDVNDEDYCSRAERKEE